MEALKSIRGMPDILPQDALIWEELETQLRDWMQRFCYAPIRLPLVEDVRLFKRVIGLETDIVQKEMYAFEDRLSGDALTLRPEGTASCARAVAQHHLLHGKKQRLWYMGPMFRHERPQKGRYRQFHQLGVEAFGFADIGIEVEQLSMCAILFDILGLKDALALQINSLGSTQDRRQYVLKLQAYLERYFNDLDEDSQRRLKLNPLRILDSKSSAVQKILEGAPRLSDSYSVDSQRRFEQLCCMLQHLKIDFHCHSALVRGLDYYNDTVFEWVEKQEDGNGSTVCAGGRYDSLLSHISKKPAPACGFAIGLERLLTLSQSVSKAKASALSPQIYLAWIGEQALLRAFEVSSELRQQGYRVVMNQDEVRLKHQLKEANRLQVVFSIIIGENELQQGVLLVKNMSQPDEERYLNLAQLKEVLLKTEKL